MHCSGCARDPLGETRRIVDRSKSAPALVKIAHGRCEIVADIARPYPVPVIAELLGAPSGDWKLFSEWADDFFKLFSWNVAEHEQTILKAWQELDDYIDAMVAERRKSLTDDLISELNRSTGVTVLLVSHELSMVSRHADHVLCLRDGKIQCQGPPAVILTPNNLAQTFGTDMQIYAHHHAHPRLVK